jgi:hypothetical protein
MTGFWVGFIAWTAFGWASLCFTTYRMYRADCVDEIEEALQL